jgi:hypothetical protein
MKNKKEWDEQIALQELQPNKFSNEDQVNMGSSAQSETDESGLDAQVCEGGIDIPEIKPWNHLELSENKVEPEKIPVKCACNKFDKIIQTLADFESGMNIEAKGVLKSGSEDDEDGENTETTGIGKAVGGEVGSHVGGYVGEYAGAAVGGYFGGPVGAAVGGAVGEYVGSKVGEQVGEQVGDQAEGTVTEMVNDGKNNNDDKNYSDSEKTNNQDNDYRKYYDYYKTGSAVASIV